MLPQKLTQKLPTASRSFSQSFLESFFKACHCRVVRVRANVPLGNHTYGFHLPGDPAHGVSVCHVCPDVRLRGPPPAPKPVSGVDSALLRIRPAGSLAKLCTGCFETAIYRMLPNWQSTECCQIGNLPNAAKLAIYRMLPNWQSTEYPPTAIY